MTAELLALFDALSPEQQADIEAHVRGLSPGPPTHPAPPHGWDCLHCGTHFITYEGAVLHFGERPDTKPVCHDTERLKTLISLQESPSSDFEQALFFARKRVNNELGAWRMALDQHKRDHDST